MLRFLAGRLFGAVIVMWLIVTISFFLMRYAPGSPFDQERALPASIMGNLWVKFNMGVELTAPEDGVVASVGAIDVGQPAPEGTVIATLQGDSGTLHTFVLPNEVAVQDLPLKAGERIAKDARVAVYPKSTWEQYWDSIGAYMRLDFGVTLTSMGQRTVAEDLAQAFPISMELGIYSLIFALLLGVTAGLIAGLKQNRWQDYTVMSGAMVGVSIPTMVSGPILIAVFVLGLGWFPYGGWEPAPGSDWSAWQYRVLPVVTLGLVYTAYFARLTRGGMLEVIRSDYIRTARAKGLSERQVVVRHGLKGGLLPVISFLGPAMASIVTGSVVIERVFGIPGLSEFFVKPAINRDYPMVLGVVVVYSVLLITMNFLVDVAYTLLDPRVKYD